MLRSTSTRLVVAALVAFAAHIATQAVVYADASSCAAPCSKPPKTIASGAAFGVLDPSGDQLSPLTLPPLNTKTKGKLIKIDFASSVMTSAPAGYAVSISVNGISLDLLANNTRNRFGTSCPTSPYCNVAGTAWLTGEDLDRFTLTPPFVVELRIGDSGAGTGNASAVYQMNATAQVLKNK